MEGQECSSSGVPSRVMKCQRPSPWQLGMITPNQFEVSAAVATPPITADPPLNVTAPPLNWVVLTEQK